MSNHTANRRLQGPMGHGRMGTEKAKDFSGAIRKLLGYMKRYKGRIAVMLIFAVAGTAFNIAGPKKEFLLGKATTELFNGLVGKVNGTGGIDFGKTA